MKPEHILALTFTDKAAGEMSDRLDKDVDTSQLTIGTFHSFCLDVLQDNILDSGISFSSGIVSRTSQLVWGLKNIDRFGFEYVELGNNGKEIIEAMIDGISAFRDELITPDMLEEYLREKDKAQLEDDERDFVGKLKDLLKVYRAYEQYKRHETLIDFDDMIYLASQLFERKPARAGHVPKTVYSTSWWTSSRTRTSPSSTWSNSSPARTSAWSATTTSRSTVSGARI